MIKLIIIIFNVYIRCYNCGDFANHIAAKCTLGPMPKRCHSCKASDHLIADCPKAQSKETITKYTKSPKKKSDRQKSRPKLKLDGDCANEDHSTVLPNQNGDEANNKEETDDWV